MNGRIDDGQWHFVTITRNKTTGRVEASVDGNGVIGVLGTATIVLNGAPDLRIGKNRANSQPLRAELDQLQIFPVVLGGDAILALYNRTNQSYCMTAGTWNTSVYWAKVAGHTAGYARWAVERQQRADPHHRQRSAYGPDHGGAEQ
jgi:hypothetical protein